MKTAVWEVTLEVFTDTSKKREDLLEEFEKNPSALKHLLTFVKSIEFARVEEEEDDG